MGLIAQPEGSNLVLLQPASIYAMFWHQSHVSEREWDAPLSGAGRVRNELHEALVSGSSTSQ